VTVGTALRIGTRGSRLAAAQARLCQTALDRDAHRSHLVVIATHGDQISALRERGAIEATDGQFTAELEAALLRGEVDLAVHSYKDLPTQSLAGLVVAAVLPRADARDCLLGATGGGLASLPDGARVGTSSVRRALQLLDARPDLRMAPIRGNVDTRIARMEGGEYDGVLLACAGLDRLGIRVPEEARLPFEVMLPAPAQGALAIQVRADRADLVARLRLLDHRLTRIAVEAERSLLRAIGGGCLAPLGAHAEVQGNRVRLRAAYAATGSRPITRVERSASTADVESLVASVASDLLAGEGAG
jgi:hydroxymethylbilane synthase